MTEATTSDALSSVIAPVLVPLGLHLYDVELAGASGRARTLRVLVERADAAPVDLDVITAATEALSSVLDTDPSADRMLRGAYTLEVSSPGLERPLRRPDHWRSVVGTLVSVKARSRGDGEGDGAVERFRGTVTGVDEHGAVLDVDGAERRVEFDDVTQARTVFEWGPAPKPGGRRKQRDEQRAARNEQKVSR